MALELILDSIDSVPEAVRSLYVEHEGKFKLDVAGVPDTAGLKSALEKERIAAREAAKQLNEFKSKYDGINPDEVKALKQQQQEAEEAKLLAEKNHEEIFRRRFEQADKANQKALLEEQAKVQAVNERLKGYESRVLEQHIERVAIGKIHSTPEAMKAVAMHFKEKFTLDQNGDAVALDGYGNIIFGKDGKTPLSPAEFLEDLKETHGFYFPALNTGGGATGSGSNYNGSHDLSKMTPMEKMRLGRQQQKRNF
jgi:hypothetical protein